MLHLLKISFLALIILPYSTAHKRDIKHPLHVSTTEAIYNAKDNSIEISSSIFTDDFENALKKVYKKKIDLSAPARHSEMDPIVKDYVLSHLKWKVNNTTVVPTYLGFELDSEVVNVFMEIRHKSDIKNIVIANTLLFDLFNDQISIMHLSNGTLRRSSKIAYPESSFTAVF